LPVSEATFLPLGNDAGAWVYRLQAGQAQYFLKVRHNLRSEASLAVPRYLCDQGVPHIVAPLPTLTGALWTRLADYLLILYPFIDGRTGRAARLTDAQWMEFGATIGRLHGAALPAELAAKVKRENFEPAWSASIRSLDARLSAGPLEDEVERALAEFWRIRRAEIRAINARAEELGRQLQAAPPPLVVCHADAHTDNVLIDANQQLWLVDWDETVHAPKERDLMFVVGASDVNNRTHPRTTQLFLAGYGPGEVDWLALAYYRYEWAVQEIGDDGERILSTAWGADTRQAALREFLRLFEPGRDVAQAYLSEARLWRGSPPE
jgi:spectinomycin phosphotransferase